MSNTDMKIRAIAPWFGSKRTLAPRIVVELGKHSAYWEPFCGSMAVMLEKKVATMETVNDLHGDLVNLARVVQHPDLGTQLYRRLRRIFLSGELFKNANASIKEDQWWRSDELDIDRAFNYFVVSWFGRNGVSGTGGSNAKFSARYTKNGGHSAKRVCSAVDSIPAWRRRMRNVTILSMDAFGLLERIEDADGVVIYIDPPYLKKGTKYLHDFCGFDHYRLAKSLSRFKKTRVVVSYYDENEIRKWYERWTLVDCEITKSLVNQGMRDRKGVTKAPEILLINGPSFGGG